MNVEYSSLESLNKTGRQKSHVARQTNQIDVAFAQHRDNHLLVLLACAAAALDYSRFNSSFVRHYQSTSAGLVADYNRDLGVWNRSFANRIDQGEHVRPTS